MVGMNGLEFGQSAVGYLFAWFDRHRTSQKNADVPNAIPALSEEAAKYKAGESGLVALDWNSGNRTVLVEQLLTGVILGQTLHIPAPEVFRALVEAQYSVL